MNYNKVIFGGNLTKDVEVKVFTKNGKEIKVGSSTVAVNETRKNANGEKVTDTVFIDFSVFGNGADVLKERFHKGSGILIDGRLKQDTYEDKDGNKRTHYEVVVDTFTFVDKLNSGSGNSKDAKTEEDYF